jgi:NarL family two-component system response regulator YdfI
MIRVWVAATSPIVRAGLTAILLAHGALVAVDRSADADVLVIDLDEGDTPKEVDWRAHPTVVLSEGTPVELLRMGYAAVLPRDVGPSELTAAVIAAAAGLVVIDRATFNSLGAFERAPFVGKPVQSLTPREVEVLRLLADGLANKEIAGRLNISDHTAKFHVAAILEKLNAASRAEAVAIGMRSGLILL